MASTLHLLLLFHLLLLAPLAHCSLCPFPPDPSLTPGCVSTALLSLDPAFTLQVGGEGGSHTCLTACRAVYPDHHTSGVAVRYVEPGEEGIICGCLHDMPSTDRIGPQVFCNLTCSGGSCGGHQGGMDYFSLYCSYRLGEDLTGVLPPSPQDQASTETPGPEASPSVTMGQLLQEVASLNSIAVILAGLLCIIVVFLLLILTYIYFKRQDKRLFKSNKKTLQALNSKLLNSEEKSYGSNNIAYDDTNDEDEVFSKDTAPITNEGKSTFFSTNGSIPNTDGDEDEVFHKGNPGVKKEGKSKFYNIESGSLPEDPREGKSQFYRQPAMDLKTPSVESDGGFQDIFAGGQLQPIESDKEEDTNKTDEN